MQIRLNETQFNRLLMIEDSNAAFKRSTSEKYDNMKAIWAEIDKKQKELQDKVFGDLDKDLYDITMEKANAMGIEYLRIPHTICNAGNSKLPESVLIVNMSSSLMCPSYYLGICTIKNGACYAQRDENQYTNNVLPNRWQTDLMHTQMLQQYKSGNRSPMRDYFGLIEKYIQLANAYSINLYKKDIENLNNSYLKEYNREMTEVEKNVIRMKYKRYKISDVRLNETGDFQCQLAVDLWAKFARKIKKRYGINTHAYTARNLDFSRASQDIAINPSHEGINIGNSDIRMFKAVDNFKFNSLDWCNVINGQPELKFDNDKSVYYYKCPCTDENSSCDNCGVCFSKNDTGRPYTIYVKYHGLVAANGLKKLFKKDEVSKVIDKLYSNGWVTDEEYNKYNSIPNQKHLNNISDKIENQRIADKKKKEKESKKGSKKSSKKVNKKGSKKIS